MMSNSPTHTVPSVVSPTTSVSLSGSLPLTDTVADYAIGHQCLVNTSAIQPRVIRAVDLFVDGEFVFTIVGSSISHGEFAEPTVQGLVGVGIKDGLLVSECNITASKVADGRSYRCRFPSLPVKLMSYIFLRYKPSPKTWCPLGTVAVSAEGLDRLKGVGANVSAVAEASPTPVMTNALLDGSVFVLVSICLCAPQGSQAGGKVAMHIIAPFSVLGHSAAVFGNICLTVFPWLVGFVILYVGKCAKWKIITQHPIMKYKVGFRATLLGMWFWLAELTYPGVVVGTFGLIRTGGDINIVLGGVGCVYLVLLPVMAVVVVGPCRSRYVTYKKLGVDDLKGEGRGMCSSLLTPQGMWGGTGPALGPLTQPFAGIHKAAWFAPMNYVVVAVVGAVLYATDEHTSCVPRLATVVVLLVVLAVVVALIRPFRYPISSLLYTVTFSLLAVYAVLITITASRHDVEHSSQEDVSGRVMGFAQLAIGVTVSVVFLVRAVVYVMLVIREGSINRMRSIKLKDGYREREAGA